MVIFQEYTSEPHYLTLVQVIANFEAYKLFLHIFNLPTTIILIMKVLTFLSAHRSPLHCCTLQCNVSVLSYCIIWTPSIPHTQHYSTNSSYPTVLALFFHGYPPSCYLRYSYTFIIVILRSSHTFCHIHPYAPMSH